MLDVAECQRIAKHPNRNGAMLVSIMRNKLSIVLISNTPKN